MNNILHDRDIQAIFLDYTGTMVKENEPYTMKLLEYFLAHSSLKVPQQALQVVWGMIKQLEKTCYGNEFIKKDEMADRILDTCVKNYGLSGDLAYMHDLWRNSWIHAPLYEDVKPFFASCPLPVFVVTNDDLCYIQESLREKELEPAGVVAAEMVNACKPHPEIFRKAIEMAGVPAGQTVLIGDSVTSDILPAKELDIVPILIDRNNTQEASDVMVIHSLLELLSS